MESVVLDQDLLATSILPCLHRREAAVAACVCRAWQSAVNRLALQQYAFRPRVMVGCSRSSQLVDVSALVEPSAVHEDELLPRTKEPPKLKRKRQSDPYWVTSIAFSPHGHRDLYVCQYHAMGIIRYCGTSLKSKGTVVQHIMIKEPEGVCFAHGFMYVQNNWGRVVRCSLEGEVLDRTYVGGELVTWAVVPGPDGHLYISADHQYKTRWYTDVPEATTGCVLRAKLRPDGSFLSDPPQPYTHTCMKRPCGLRWGPICGTLFVTCLDPAVLRFAGPTHATPGVLLSRISLGPGMLPWDVIIMRGNTLIVTVHKRRTLRPPKPVKKAAAAAAATARSSRQRSAGPTPAAQALTAVVQEAGASAQGQQHVDTFGPSKNTQQDTGVLTMSTQGEIHKEGGHVAPDVCTYATSQTQAPVSASVDEVNVTQGGSGGSGGVSQGWGGEVGQEGGVQSGQGSGVEVTEVGCSSGVQEPCATQEEDLVNSLLDEGRGFLCIISDLGEGKPRFVSLPPWMDHANMMCVEE